MEPLTIRMTDEMRREVDRIAAENERPAAWMVRAWIDRGLEDDEYNKATPVEKYAKVAQFPALFVQQYVIKRAAMQLAEQGGSCEIEALRLIRGAFGASLEEAREIMQAMKSAIDNQRAV